MSEIFTPAILASDKQLRSYKEIFYKDGELQKRVVLLGEAGRGKTTFCKHLANIWQGSTTVSQFCDIDVLKKFGYLFYVSCRFAEEQETILNMIANQVLGGDSKMTVARYVLQYLPYLCLIIVDGFDEWAGSPTSCTGRMGDIAGMPGLAGVEDCVILITSRPWRFVSLSSHTQKIFIRLNIDGIKNVKELSQQVLHKLEDQEPAKSADEFLSQVEERNMSALMQNPLILIIALRGWVGDNDDETVRSLHKSMCINYINMIQTVIRRSEGQAGWPRPESKLRQLVPNFENLKIKWGQKSNELPHVFSQYKDVQRYAGLLLSVGQLAFDLLVGTEEQSLVFSKGKVKKYLPADDENDESINACLAFGIISKTETTTRGLKKLESYAFCHKTFQEFFAALWLASKYQTVKTKLFKCIKTVKNLQGFEILIRFLCGFDPVIGKEIWMFVTEEVEFSKKRESWQWEAVQRLACRCMKEQEVDPNDQKSSQIYFCIHHITIGEYTSDEDIMLLCHVTEEYYSSVKSVEVHGCESHQLVQNIYRSVSSCSGLQKMYLSHLPAVNSTVLDLQKHNKLENLELEYISVEGLLLPMEGATITTLDLYKVTMNHHGLEQLAESLSFCDSLLRVDLMNVRCREHTDGVCIPVLDLQKHNKLENLKLGYTSVEGLLLPVEGAIITSLKLDDVTMTHHGLIQLEQSLSTCTSLVEIYLASVKCSDDNIPVIDLQKHNKLKKVDLKDISVKGLLLPMEGATITTLDLFKVTMNHHGLEQLAESLSFCDSLLSVDLMKVRCSEHTDGVCIPVLDLQIYKKLEKLDLKDISVEGLLLPGEGATITTLDLFKVTMKYHGLEQLAESLSFCDSLLSVDLMKVRCSEHTEGVCIPVLDLQKYKKLEKLDLKDISVEGLLLPREGATIRLLDLYNVTMTHHGSKQLLRYLSSCCRQVVLLEYSVTCSNHSDTPCHLVLNPQTQDMLERKKLDLLSVRGRLSPPEEANTTSLQLCNVTMSHQSLDNLLESLSYSPNLVKLDLRDVACSDHDNCIVQDVQIHNHLEKRKLYDISVKGLLLYNLTITHHSLEQVVKFVSFCPGLEDLDVRKVKCVEHNDIVCIPVLDLLKHNNLKQLTLDTIPVENLLLPVGEASITSLWLHNLTITHHSLEQVVKFVTFCTSLEKLDVREVKCVEHDDTVCIPVLDLQKLNNLLN